MSDYTTRLLRDKQHRMASRVRDGEDPDDVGFGVLSTSEKICVALAAGRYDLLPAGWSDPLEAFIKRLDPQQRDIVRLIREDYNLEGDRR